MRSGKLAISDGYVEKGIQLQPVLVVVILLSIILGIFFPLSLVIALLCISLLLVISFDFITFVTKRDSSLLKLTILLLFLRSLSWALGALTALAGQAK